MLGLKRIFHNLFGLNDRKFSRVQSLCEQNRDCGISDSFSTEHVRFSFADQCHSSLKMSDDELQDLLRATAHRIPTRELVRVVSEVLESRESVHRQPGQRNDYFQSYTRHVEANCTGRISLSTDGDLALVQKKSSAPDLELSKQDAIDLLTKVFPVDLLPALNADVGGEISGAHSDVSVFFSDIVGFTEWSSRVSPSTVINCLSAYFQILDDLAERLGVYKVETIGDAWMAVCGAPYARDDHAQIMATFALQAIDTVKDLRAIFNDEALNIRVGVHTGPVVSGVVRADRPRWQLFGDTVNMASRMESTGLPGMVQVSAEMHAALQACSDTEFLFQRRGNILVKGKGDLETFFLTGVGSESGLLRSELSRNRLSYFNQDMELIEQEFGQIDDSRRCRGAQSSTSMEMKEEDVEKDLELPSQPLGLSRMRLTIGSVDCLAGLPGIPESDCDDNNLEDWDAFHIKSRAHSLSFENISQNMLEERAYSYTQARGPAVLLVDNSVSTMMQYRRLLTSSGVHVTTAHSCNEAVGYMKRTEFAVVYCDCPHSTGFISLFREWESVHRTHRQLIVGLVPSVEKADEDALKRAGIDIIESKTNSKERILKYVCESFLVPPQRQRTQSLLQKN